MEIRFNSKTAKHAVLSNFYQEPFELTLKCGSFYFDNAEAAFQVCKHSPLTAQIAQEWSRLPGNVARERGRKCPMRPDWNDKRIDAMRWVLKAKFAPGTKARMMLFTYPEDAVFVHEAPWDSYWGTGRDGRGQNMLGQLIGELRSQLS